MVLLSVSQSGDSGNKRQSKQIQQCYFVLSNLDWVFGCWMFWSVIYWGCGYFELCSQEWDSSGSSWALLKSYSSKIKSLIGGLGSVLAFCKVGALGEGSC